MAITQSLKISEGFTADASSYTTTDSLTAVANKLYLVCVASIGVDDAAPTLTHNAATNPLSFTQMTSVEQPNGLGRITTYRAMGTLDSGAGTIGISFPGGTQSRAAIIVSEFSGVDTSGSNGSGAILQTGITATDDGTLSTVTTTLASLSGADNRPWQCSMYQNDNANHTPDSNYIEIAEIQMLTVDELCVASQWDDDGQDLTATATYTTGDDKAAIAHELVALVALSAVSEVKIVHELTFRR